MSAKLVPNFADRACRVVSATDPHGRILGFLDRSCYYFFQVAPPLYSRGWVDPVPDPLLLRKSCSAGIEPGISGSVARNSDHYTTVAVGIVCLRAKATEFVICIFSFWMLVVVRQKIFHEYFKSIRYAFKFKYTVIFIILSGKFMAHNMYYSCSHVLIVLATMFNTELVGMCMVHLLATGYMSNSSDFCCLSKS
jgi:hypothetical protein